MAAVWSTGTFSESFLCRFCIPESKWDRSGEIQCLNWNQYMQSAATNAMAQVCARKSFSASKHFILLLSISYIKTRWYGEIVTFSVLPLNFPRMLKRGTCGIISCSFSSLYSGAVGRSRVKNKKVDSDSCSWYSSVRSNASFSSGS